MTDDEIRVAVAQACGWKRVQHTYLGGESAGFSWVAPDGVGRCLPDFVNDLNAMHEAEMILTEPSQRDAYCLQLVKVTMGLVDWSWDTIRADSWKIVTPTARERAEAFLRVLANWRKDI